MKKLIVTLGLISMLGCSQKAAEPKLTPVDLDYTAKLNNVMDRVNDAQNQLNQKITHNHSELTKLIKEKFAEYELCIKNANTRIKALLKKEGITDPVKREPSHHQ